jgi:hypothetical protein
MERQDAALGEARAAPPIRTRPVSREHPSRASGQSAVGSLGMFDLGERCGRQTNVHRETVMTGT